MVFFNKGLTMHYLDETVHAPLRFAVPQELYSTGEALQEILGAQSMFLATSQSMFYDALTSGFANSWVADFDFLENAHHEIDLSVFPLLLIRTPHRPLTAHSLNRWTPSAFVDLPLEKEEVASAVLKLEEALHVKEDLELLTALKSTLVKGQKRQIVLDMERAFDKEINIIRNDFYYQQIQLPRRPSVMLRIDAAYKPMEFLSGDSYSVRRAGEHKMLFFLLDAMSKGIVAALTSTTSTSVLNYLVDELENAFSLEVLVEKYLSFITKELMEDEIISLFFLVFDTQELTLEFASFGMPPFLVTTPNGKYEAIKANNMPISPYTQGFSINTLEVGHFNRFLAYSDGLNESQTQEGELYRKKLPQDFLHSVNISDFTGKVNERIGSGGDDIAYFYLQAIDTKRGKMESFALKSTREEMEKGLYLVKPFLEHHGASVKELAQSTLALSELLTNALEHGSFGVDKAHKHRYIQEGTFEQILEELEHSLLAERTVWLHLRVYRQGKWKIFEATVEDEGEGFDTHVLKDGIVRPASVNGRGFLIVRKLVDRLYFNPKGNAVTLLKKLG